MNKKIRLQSEIVAIAQDETLESAVAHELELKSSEAEDGEKLKALLEEIKDNNENTTRNDGKRNP